jgi:hypothetical protein
MAFSSYQDARLRHGIQLGRQSETFWIRLSSLEYFILYLKRAGVRGGAVGWGTALQTKRSQVRFPMESLEIFSDLILPVALWPWGRFSL